MNEEVKYRAEHGFNICKYLDKDSYEKILQCYGCKMPKEFSHVVQCPHVVHYENNLYCLVEGVI